mmetsp:Transcript_18032/g.39331  ORF Transcript_18032/g.39331 Transcript_18032/m.39331 type:complete len:205 (+) Transcript_18032:2027-2641(+)
MLFLPPSRPLPPSVFFCLDFFPSAPFPLSRLSELVLASLFVLAGVTIPNLAARAFFFSSKVIPFNSVTFATGTAKVTAAGAATAAEDSLPLPLSSISLGFSSTTAVVSSTFFSDSSAEASLTTSGSFGLEADTIDSAAAVGVVATGASAKPNSSSSRRTCNRFTSSALSPSVGSPRLESSPRRSDTFIFFISSAFMLTAFRSFV